MGYFSELDVEIKESQSTAKFIIVLNADINPDLSDCNYQVALRLNNDSYYYIADYMTKSDALALATSLNVINHLTGN